MPKYIHKKSDNILRASDMPTSEEIQNLVQEISEEFRTVCNPPLWENVKRGTRPMKDQTQLELFPDSEDQHGCNILNRVREMLREQIEPRQIIGLDTHYKDLSEFNTLKFEGLEIKISDQIELKLSLTTRQKRRA